MKRRLIMMLAVALLGTQPAVAQETQVDGNFRYHSFGWDGNGRTIVSWRAVIVDGKVTICGVYSSSGGAKYANLTRQAIRDFRIEGPDGTFMRNLNFFERVSARNHGPRLLGASANCRVTGTPGTAADLRSYRVDFTPQRYRTN